MVRISGLLRRVPGKAILNQPILGLLVDGMVKFMAPVIY